MPIESTIREKTFAGRGDTGPYPIQFPVELDPLTSAARNVVVEWKNAADGQIYDVTAQCTFQHLNVYTPAEYQPEDRVTLRRVTPRKQAEDLKYAKSYDAKQLQGIFDRTQMQIIEVEDEASGGAGEQGDSAYQAWLDAGNVGSVEDFLAALEGPAGPAGANGEGVPAGGAAGEALIKTSGADYDTEWGEVATAEVERGIFHIQHTVAPGANAGSVSAGAWRTGPLNTVTRNDITGASLSANEFTLPAGKYRISGFRAAFYVNAYATRIFNVTDGITELIGMNGYADQGDGYNSEHIPIQGVIEILAPKTFRVELYPQTGRSNDGWGFNTNSYGGLDRVWADFIIEDLTSTQGQKGADGTTTTDSATGNFNVTGILTMGELRIPVVTSDPPAPAAGQIWFRGDLV